MAFAARISKTVLEPLPDGKRFKLARAIHYEIEGQSWVVPPGTTTDFASIPGIGRLFLPKWGRYGWAAILHDFLYSKQGPDIERREADRVFLAFMKVRGVNLVHMALIYLSVRAFGWMFFKQD